MTETSEQKTLQTLDIERIMQMIPHRYPILLVDRVVDIDGNGNGCGIKGVTVNEPFFQGHFPGKPVMPGVLILEALAQTMALVTVADMGADAEGKLVYLMSIDQAKFRRPVVPGDRLELHVEQDKVRGSIRRFKGQAKVDGKVCAEAVIQAMIADKE